MRLRLFFDIYDKYTDNKGFLNKDLSDKGIHIENGVYLTSFIKENDICYLHLKVKTYRVFIRPRLSFASFWNIAIFLYFFQIINAYYATIIVWK